MIVETAPDGDAPSPEDLREVAGMIRASGGPVAGTILSVDGGESWEEITAADVVALERQSRRLLTTKAAAC